MMRRGGGGGGGGGGGRGVARQDPAPRRRSSSHGTNRPARSANCVEHRAPAATGSGGAQRSPITGRDRTPKDWGAPRRRSDRGGGVLQKTAGSKTDPLEAR